jgi:hypothetical protein
MFRHFCDVSLFDKQNLIFLFFFLFPSLFQLIGKELGRHGTGNEIEFEGCQHGHGRD